MKKASIISAMLLFILCLSEGVISACVCISNGNWSDNSLWSSCTGTGGLPGSSDDVYLGTILPPQPNVTADSDISVSSIKIFLSSTLNAGSYTITLSGATPIIFDGTFNAGTGTVKLTDADHTITSMAAAVTFNNLIMEPLTAPRTITIGSTFPMVLSVNGDFISGSSATNQVSFVKGNAGSNVTNAVTSYYCASNGGIANINCVAGGPPVPEINLKQGATNIASADSHNFGSVAVGSNSGAITFTIENTGSVNLTLGGTPKIVKSGADAADFTVDETSTTTPVAGAASTTFTVTFTPSSAAAKTASLSIANNDSDENPYTVTLNGTGTTTPTPGYGSNPAPGSTVNVGTAAVGSPVSTALQVSETGNAALNVTSHALGGANPGDFSVTPATLSIADGGAAQNLTVQCIPGAAGLRTATLTVNHNAAGSPATYTLNCTGTGGATTTTLPPAGGLPPAPSGLTAKSLSDKEILLTWTDNSSNETGFIIERFDGIKWETAGTVGANVTSFTDTGLRYTWEYSYRVIAYNASGSSLPGGGASAWTWMHPYAECDGVALNGAVWFADVNLPENSPPGTVIGTFTTINPTGTHRYEFYPPIPIAGIDNDQFEIVGNVLRTGKNFTPDFETRQRYRISLRSVDVNANYAWCHAEFGIVITDVADTAPASPARSLRASVSIDSATADGTAAPGDTLRLSADIVNEGETDVTGAVLTVPLPAGTVYAAPAKRSESQVTYNAELNQIVWTGDIPAGQTAQIAFDLKVAETAKTGDVIAPGEWSLACDTDGDGAADMTVMPEDAQTAPSGVTVVVPEPECLTGDVNGDGEISLADAVTVLQILVGTEADAPALCADVNGDGNIGFAELFVILGGLAE